MIGWIRVERWKLSHRNFLNGLKRVTLFSRLLLALCLSCHKFPTVAQAQQSHFHPQPPPFTADYITCPSVTLFGWERSQLLAWALISEMCPVSIFFPGWAWICLPFQHLLCPFNKQHAALIHVEFPLLPPLSAVSRVIVQFVSVDVRFFTKLFISSSPFVPTQPTQGHVLGWRRLQGVGWSYRGCGGKPREVLLFLMCCRSPTQPPTSTSTSTPHRHQPPPPPQPQSSY